jgi:hypothetical protein
MGLEWVHRSSSVLHSTNRPFRALLNYILSVIPLDSGTLSCTAARILCNTFFAGIGQVLNDSYSIRKVQEVTGRYIPPVNCIRFDLGMSTTKF